MPRYDPLLSLGLFVWPARHPKQAFPEYPWNLQSTLFGLAGCLFRVRTPYTLEKGNLC